MGVMPLSELANLENPALAYVMQAAVGDWGAVLINFAVSLSLIGAMLGYTVLASESPFEAAEEGVFIRAFAKTNDKGAPVVTLVVTNIIIELAVHRFHLPVLLHAVRRYDPSAVPAFGRLLREGGLQRARRVQGAS